MVEKDMFATVNRLTKQACPSVKAVKSDSGETLTDQADTEQEENLLRNTVMNMRVHVRNRTEPTPTYEEVEKSTQVDENRESGRTGRKDAGLFLVSFAPR